MKKFLALLLALVMALSLFACGKKENDTDKAKVKVGFITLHDENSTYDLNFINAAKAAIIRPRLPPSTDRPTGF